MRLTTIILGLIIASTSFACPNFSGDYEILPNERSLSGIISIEQEGCYKLKFLHDSGRFFSEYYLDEQMYEEKTDSNQNSYANIPINENSTDFVKAFITNRRVVVMNYDTDDNYKNCKGKYSFSSFNCKLRETSLGYNNDGELTWVRKGWWRSGDSRYQDMELILKKL